IIASARSSRVAPSLEVLLEPGEDLLPAVHRGVHAILRAVDGEERVPGVFVRVELVSFPELLARFLGLGDVLRRGACVLDAEQFEQRALEILGELDRGTRLTRGQLLGLGDDTTAIAVDRGVDAAEGTGGQVRLAAAGTVADDPNLAVQIRQGPKVIDRALDIAQRAIVRHASGRADTGAVLLRRGLPLTEMEVWRNRDVAVVGESPGDLLGRSVPARHVMNDDHARLRANSKRSRQIRIDLIAQVPADQHRLGEERFVRHRVPPSSSTTWPNAARARISPSAAASSLRAPSPAARAESRGPTCASSRRGRGDAAGPAPPSPARSDPRAGRR